MSASTRWNTHNRYKYNRQVIHEILHFFFFFAKGRYYYGIYQEGCSGFGVAAMEL